MFWSLLFFMIFQNNALADIFKADEKDGQLVSAYSVPYHFTKSNVRPMISWGMDKNKEIDVAIGKLSRMNIDRSVISNAPLLLWEYSAPAEADTFKHFQTIAYLRYTLDQQRLNDLETNNRGLMNALGKQGVYDCIQEKFFVRHGFANDLSGLLDSCRTDTVLKDLNFADGSDLYTKLFNKFNLRGERRDKILSILPVWRLDKDGIDSKGPAKRIGQLLKENRDANRNVLNAVLDQYQSQRTADEQQLSALSLPKRPFNQMDILSLLSLSVPQRAKHIEEISAQLSFSQTIDQYDEAIEWLNRYIDHPNVEDVYKTIIQKGIGYLVNEKASLNEKLNQIKSYAKTLDLMANDAMQEQTDVLRRSKDQEQFRIMEGL